HAMKVRFQHQGRLLTIEYPPWIELPQDRLSDDDIVTANLGKLVFASAGALVDQTAEDLTFTPLVSSSDTAALLDVGVIGPGQDPQSLMDTYKPVGKSLVLAARLAGSLNSAFPTGAPPPPEASANAKPADDSDDKMAPMPHLAKSKEPTNIVVVADTDLLVDRSWVQVQELLGTRLAVPSAGNGSFVINVLDNLTGSNDLISVRSRGRYTRPFTRVDDIRRDAELRFRAKEQQLVEELRTTEQKLLALGKSQPEAGGGELVLSAEQRAEIERFRAEKVRIRKDLRSVLHERSKNIDALESNIRMLNLVLMPLLIVIIGLLVAFWQTQRRRSATAMSE
ncbi:MAG: ABC transporter, partial [Chromatiales bacterium]|nr:ABC transporter [Chromatiales bacterium]